MSRFLLICALLFGTISQLGAEIYIKGGVSAWGYIGNAYSTSLFPAREDPITGDYEKIPDEEAVSTDFDPGEGYETEPFNSSYFLEVATPLGLGGNFRHLMGGIGGGYISNPAISLDPGEKNSLGNEKTWGFASIPVYALTKYNLPLGNEIIPYIILKGGMNIPLQQENTDMEEVNPGIYAAAGVGIEFFLVQFELLYSFSTVHIPDYSQHTTYTEENDEGEKVEMDGIIEGDDNFYYNQILICTGIKLDLF